jgi:hypothetical protein
MASNPDVDKSAPPKKTAKKKAKKR